MRPIATDGGALSVGLSVCNDSERFKNGWTDRDTVRNVDSGRPKEPRIRWGPDLDPHVKRQFWGRKGAGSGHARTCPDALDSLANVHPVSSTSQSVSAP